MRGSLPLRIANIVCVFLFVLFAWFQRNDIDPEIYYKPSGIDATLWFIFYLLIAVMFAITLFRNVPVWLIVLSVVFCLIEMGLSGPGLYENLVGEEEFTMTQVSMSAEDPRVELSREFFGALIALLAVLWIFWQQRRLSQSLQSS